MTILHMHLLHTTVGCFAALGHCFLAWSLADVAELSFVGSLVEGS